MSIIFGSRQRPSADEAVLESLNTIKTGFIDETPAGLQQIVTESAEEMYRLSGSLYISDVMITESVVMEGAQLEPLVENFVKNTWDKLKEVFMKLWAKLREWFNKVKTFLKRVFLSGEKFIKEFGEIIRSKSDEGFTYTGYQYNVDAGDKAVDAKRRIIDGFLAEQIKFEISDAQKEVIGINTDGEGQEGSIRKNAATLDQDKLKTDLRKSLGDENFTEVLKEIRLIYRGGKDEPVEIKGIDKDRMINFIQKNASSVKEIEERQKRMDADFKQVLGAIDKARSKIQSNKELSEAEKAKLTTYATTKYRVAHYALGLQQSLTSVMVDMYREVASKYESVLKSFLRFKPAKESYGFDNEEEENASGQQYSTSQSILESAAKWL